MSTAMDTPPLVDPVQDEIQRLQTRVAELEQELAGARAEHEARLTAAYIRIEDVEFQRDAARDLVGAHQDEIQALNLELDGMRRSHTTTVKATGGLL